MLAFLRLFTPPTVSLSSSALSQGLETDPITGYVVARPGSSDWSRLAADQEAWAAQVRRGIAGLAWVDDGGVCMCGRGRAGSGIGTVRARPWHTLVSFRHLSAGQQASAHRPPCASPTALAVDRQQHQ